ncbi:hypothetical protein DL89DRAFT_271551 [Linderina pennispora]|uniref:Uncharacterized protein n=1 Tax=Linderina pennispora TaxID=61395 RepID=A0A1Y1VUQ7_9FUNG|nr:uncharacterized protein DL89DRAFT_271546 [Linderina pennispora]XP_040739435.1 uncharacterized protein DL89DRAFT_271551 [Linderina pennispora]ORX65021.1 hypothetical protein DL89DRAFT_271546 [Linderina pennispora]ORX65023.1 hypothetical protein DL89DRAFT_271551 [Linderina pennispora]
MLESDEHEHDDSARTPTISPDPAPTDPSPHVVQQCSTFMPQRPVTGIPVVHATQRH